MARIRRQVGIRQAQVQLPERVDIGPAIVKTAQTIHDIQAEKLADKRRQEATLAAAKLNFERDGDGNLVAPSLPMGDNGLLAPSIYDRTYTQMVSQRYIQQIKIDTNERLNTIATQHRFDPTAYREVAEAYVAKVTELAPDLIKPDVNATAQITMVEHFNHITREKAERDHLEAKGVHLQTIDNLNDELIGYVESDADPEIIGGKMLEIRAAIEQGDEFNYWLDDEKMLMLENIDKRYALAAVVGQINNIPDDPLAYAEAIEKMTEFSQGTGKINMVDEAGNVAAVDVTEVYPNPDDRQAIADHAIGLLQQRATSFANVQDERLKRDWEKFHNWWSPHALTAASPGTGVQVNMKRLYEEFDKAHQKVIDFGYDDALREEIRRIIMDQIGGGEKLSDEEEFFFEDFQAWLRMTDAETEKKLGGRDPNKLSPQELLELDFFVTNDVGNLSSGNRQTAGNSRFISKYYSPFVGANLEGPEGRDFWNDLLQNPNHEKWQDVQFMAQYRLGKIGIWPVELTDAVVGKFNDPEGMSPESLQNALRLVRTFWDQPTFRANMTDENALGHRVGRAIDHLFRMGDQPTPERMAELMQKFGDPNWSPYTDYRQRPAEEKEMFEAAMDDQIDKYFHSSWKTGWMPKGAQAMSLGLNPFDRDVAIPGTVKEAVRARVRESAGFIDAADPETFLPFIARATETAMREKGYATTQLGYSPLRYGENYRFEMTRPDTAVVQFPPEYFAIDPTTGAVDRGLMQQFEKDFQTVLDWYAKERKLPANQKWIAGKNAALQYDGDGTQQFGYPVWNVVLIKADGITTEILTHNGLYGGDRVMINMNNARKVNDARKDADRRRRNLAVGQRRIDYQTGRTHEPTMYGSNL